MSNILNKSSHPVHVNRIPVRMWCLRDEIEQAVSERMKECAEKGVELDISDIKEFYTQVKKDFSSSATQNSEDKSDVDSSEQNTEDEKDALEKLEDIEAKEKESGITIHFVNAHYDEGEIIFQTQCPVLESDTYQEVAQKVHDLEYEHYPKVIDTLIQKT